nr:hypothetical protein [Nanoarchaeum sp.]
MESQKRNISTLLFEAAKTTWEHRKGNIGEIFSPNDNFSGLRYVKIDNLPTGTILSSNSDGIGTKIEISERLEDFTTIAYDLFAMVCDDTVSKGLEPIIINTVLDVNTLNLHEQQVSQLIQGYTNAALDSNVAIINGETAELGSRVYGYGPFNCNWSATAIGIGNIRRAITCQDIRPNQYLVGLKEKCFRSNGLTLARQTLEFALGEEWHNITFNNSTLGRLALTPSTIYTEAIVDLFGGWNLEREQKAKLLGVAHITGGSIPEKLGRVLRVKGYGAKIDDPFEPSEIMKECQRLGRISDEKAYSNWNMGQGMILITEEPEKVMQVLSTHSIESKVIGKTTYNNEIRIKSKGYYSRNSFLSYPPK